MRPHRRQPTRLPRPWDSPGKNTGVGCHFLQGPEIYVLSIRSISPLIKLALWLVWIKEYEGNSVFLAKSGVSSHHLSPYFSPSIGRNKRILRWGIQMLCLCLEVSTQENYLIISICPWHKPWINTNCTRTCPNLLRQIMCRILCIYFCLCLVCFTPILILWQCHLKFSLRIKWPSLPDLQKWKRFS